MSKLQRDKTQEIKDLLV